MKPLATKKIGQFDGWAGSKREIMEITERTSIVSSHSCLLPEFSITVRVGELRKLIERMDDDIGLTVTVTAHEGTKLTFVK